MPSSQEFSTLSCTSGVRRPSIIPVLLPVNQVAVVDLRTKKTDDGANLLEFLEGLSKIIHVKHMEINSNTINVKHLFLLLLLSLLLLL